MQSVTNAGSSSTNIGLGTTSYTYDTSGNLKTATNTTNPQHNKSFTYNIFSLPSVVTVSNGTDTYTYDAGGTKLRRVSVMSGVTTNTDYIAGIQYNGSGTSDALNFIQTEEGQAVLQTYLTYTSLAFRSLPYRCPNVSDFGRLCTS